MKADEAMLLPNIHRDFIKEIHGNIALFSSIVHVSGDDIPTTRWLLPHLHLHFNARLEVQCRHKRYGTLLYHKSCDLVRALSSALGKSEAKTTCRSCSEHEVQQHTVPTMKEQLQTVALHMNTKLHEQARMLRGSFDASPESIASLNLRDAWDNTDPELLTFLSLMTQPVRYTKRKLFESVPTPTELNTKSIRLFYALCVLLFCTNNTCSVPLHVLLMEAVLCHGSTLELIQILNRLGAVASVETLNRLATHVVETRLSEQHSPHSIIQQEPIAPSSSNYFQDIDSEYQQSHSSS